MNYRKIIGDSWKYTQENKKLVYWFGVFPAFFTTTVGVGMIGYQFLAFKKSYLFSEGDEGALHYVVALIWDFVTKHVSWTVPLVIVVIIFAIIYFLFPTLAKAAAIQKIARNRNGQDATVGTGLRYGMMSFLPLLEYHLLINTFAFFSILTEMSFVVRNLGVGLFKIFLPFFIIFMFISLLLTLLFTYTDFYIVVDGNGVFESMKKSAKLVVMNWKHTFLITILMLIIGVRIIIQAVMVFLIPALVILVVGYLTTVAVAGTSIVIGGIVGLVALYIAAYLNGVVDIFAFSVWTFTFLDVTEQKEMSAREVQDARTKVDEELETPIVKNHEEEDPVRHKNLEK